MTHNVTPSHQLPVNDQKTINAAIQYLRRASRRELPDGKLDDASRFYPSDSEKCGCCSVIRPPSRTWPETLLDHCCTAKHVARKHGADEKATRKMADFIRKNNVDIIEKDAASLVAMLLDSIKAINTAHLKSDCL